MKIIEARDGFIKFETDKSVKISSFIEVKGIEKRYIAQIVRTKDNGAGNTVYAKILFVYDGTFKKYDRTLPDVSSNIENFSFDIINNSFSISEPIVAGKFIENKTDIYIDADCFKSMLISVDNPETNNIIVSNIAKQFKQTKNVLIVDMLGVINSDKYEAGRDFKLPLNKSSLEFLYEDCLNDVTADSKNTIKEIFTDLSEYADEVPFLPFSALKTIVDDMVEKSHIFKLLVLKNKLDKFANAGYFASTKNEADVLEKIIKNNYAVLDLSKVEPLFQNRYLSVIYSKLEELKLNAQAFVIASNAINKKNLKKIIYPENNIKTTFITHSKFKYISEIKNLFNNFILENTYSNCNVFDIYSFFLNSMDSKKYLIVGSGTNFIPLISNVEKFDITVKPKLPDVTADEVIKSEYDSDIPETEEYTNYEKPEANQEVTETEAAEEDTDLYEMKEPEETDNVADEISDIVTDTEKPAEEVEQETDFHTSVDDTMLISDENVPEEISENILEPEILPDKEDTEDLSLNEVPDNEDVIIEVEEEITTPISDNSEELVEAEEEIITPISDNSEELVEAEEVIKDEDPISIPSELEADYTEIEDNSSDTIEAVEEDNTIAEYKEPEVMSLGNQDSDFDEIVELDASEISDEDILVDLSDDDEISEAEKTELTPEELDKEIVEDVDKVFTTMKDDSISESDLDFIDTLNEFDNDESEQNESEMFGDNDIEALEALASEDEDDNGFLEPLQEVSDAHEAEEEKEILQKRDTSTPIVPVYDAEIPEEDKIMSDHVEQGDSVIHAKYGSGVVEKVIKYGNKTLHSINFDNVGRRLLDLEITEVKKA